ncbi:hypothetical protein B0T10DRAFT_203026 [Thelonectria olida]|uniref:Uncharacterized protein n=1 Tax=Thelonectria olida TaxID=1576542 RepID=A0A9P9AJL1_9HYPO|nr:hypothetical protein B0T10DRAFT_203026 [Thelonectria olida]
MVLFDNSLFEAYKEGQILDLRASLGDGDPPETCDIRVQIRKKLVNSSSVGSCDMLVDILDKTLVLTDGAVPETALLKLFDRRFSVVGRMRHKLPLWTSEREKSLVHMALNSNLAPDEIHRLWGDWQLFREETQKRMITTRQEQALAIELSDTCKAELFTYAFSLRSLQSINIRRLLASVHRDLAPRDVLMGIAASDHFGFSGLLLEPLFGYSLADMSQHFPRSS